MLESQLAIFQSQVYAGAFPASCERGHHDCQRSDALRRSRSKDRRTQEVRLPHGYLAARDDDAPPAADVSDWDAALSGG